MEDGFKISDDSTIELKECPYCFSYNCSVITMNGDEFYVMCDDCCLCGPRVSTGFWAIRTFNRMTFDGRRS